MPRCARVRYASACRALSSGTILSLDRVETIYDTRRSCIFRPRNGISECEPQIGEAVASWRCSAPVSMAPLSSCYPRATAAFVPFVRSLSLVDGTHADGVLCRRVISFACRRRFGAGFGDGLARCRRRFDAACLVSSVVRFGRSSAASSPAGRSRASSCTTATWLILPVVICLSQRLSHACLSTNLYTVKLRMAH